MQDLVCFRFIFTETPIMASKREKIKLKSSKSAFFYFTTKNKTKTPDRITLRKFDPTIREHCEFKETK